MSVKLALVSDAHLTFKKFIARKDNAVNAGLRKFNEVLNWCEENEASLVIAGDLFDKPRSWFMLAQTMDMIRKSGVSIFAVYGQHDIYFRSKDTIDRTNLGILRKAGLVKILSDIPVEVPTTRGKRGLQVRIYGASYGEEIPEPIETEQASIYNMLVVHAPIYSGSINKVETLNALSFLKKHPYDLIHCGDIHRRFEVETNQSILLNPGPLLRKTAEEYNFTHKPGFFDMTFYSGSEWEYKFVEVEHKPASEVLTRSHLITTDGVDLDNFLEMFTSDEQCEFTDFIVSFEKYCKYRKVNPEIYDLVSAIADEYLQGEEVD